MKNKRYYILAGISAILILILICLIRMVDVAQIGPEGTSIGLSHINDLVFHTFGVNLIWYKLTNVLGIAAILTAALFGLLGLVQLIKRRSLRKVDREILALGGLYIVLICLYVLFEKVIINYRPIIMPDETQPEASFPSSHTMLVCVVMGSAMTLISKYIKQATLQNILLAVCDVVLGLTVAGRLLSGVHWFTDIMGGVLFSIMLLAIFGGITSTSASRKTNGKRRS